MICTSIYCKLKNETDTKKTILGQTIHKLVFISSIKIHVHEDFLNICGLQLGTIGVNQILALKPNFKCVTTI